MRVEWTIIADGQHTVPGEEQRYALVDRFIAMSQGREHAVIHFEIANESWQNGFDGDAGLAQLRALSAYLRERTDILVAASAPPGVSCADYEAVYSGEISDVATIHLDRDTSTNEGHWRPVRMPWGLADCALPVASNNEPIGPGSSVASENHPIHLVSAAIVSYIANVPFHVFHTRAGVRGDFDFTDMDGVDAFKAVLPLLPGDLPDWSRRNAHWADSVFRIYAVDAQGTAIPDAIWPDLDGAQAGVVRAYGAVKEPDFVAYPFGILDHVTLEARRPMVFDVIDPLGGTPVMTDRMLGAGEQLVLDGGEAFLIKGHFL